ncbi:MAG: GNAT family N-acetyltransferase [Nocardioidaceae bacterium]
MLATELGEAEFMFAMFTAADDLTRHTLGMAQHRVGGGEVTVMREDPTGGFWSRAIGLGLTEPVTETVVDEVLGFAHEHGARTLVFQVAPGARGDWERLLAERGAQPGSAWVKFAGPADLAARTRTDLRVGPTTPEDADRFAHVLCVGFEMPLDSPLPGWFAQLARVRDTGFTTYGAWDGDAMVAAATLFVGNGVGTLAGAATLPSHRGRGAQQALMVRRMRDAAAAGCAVVTCETGAETAADPNPSLHNMRRLGLTELYERRNWVWRP